VETVPVLSRKLPAYSTIIKTGVLCRKYVHTQPQDPRVCVNRGASMRLEKFGFSFKVEVKGLGLVFRVWAYSPPVRNPLVAAREQRQRPV